MPTSQFPVSVQTKQTRCEDVDEWIRRLVSSRPTRMVLGSNPVIGRLIISTISEILIL